MSVDTGAGTAPIYDGWSAYYDLIEGDRTAISAFYAGRVRPDDRSLLDLGCGTGTITIAIVRALAAAAGDGGSVRAVGLDASPRMLEQARGRDPSIDWRLGDLCSPPVAGPFDLVTCGYNTLQMLPGTADVAQALRSARALLAPDGRLVFDLFQPNLPLLRTPTRNRLVQTAVADGRAVELREDRAFDESRMLLELDWFLRDPATADTLAAIRYRFFQYPHAQIRQLLEEAGLRIVEAYGDFDGRPFDAASMRQVLVCARDDAPRAA